MPPTATKSGTYLAIHLDNPSQTFHPGSVITGTVTRSDHAVSPTATVEIRVLGRAKTKIAKTRTTGQATWTDYYRGRFNFFDDSAATCLHSGPLHIAQGDAGQTWPFEIRIPTIVSPEALLSQHQDPRSSFLPLDPTSVASSSLPGTFTAKGRSLSRSMTFNSYIEYHLEATLVQHSTHGATCTATQPIHLQPLPPPYPLSSPGLTRSTLSSTVATHRLAPGMQDTHLTLKQKTQKLFHSSRVPGLAFKLSIDSPSAIQLGHPSPTPFRLSITPNRLSSSDEIQDAAHEAVVTSLELVLKAKTSVVAPGSRSRASYGSASTYEMDDVDKHRILLPVYAPPGLAPPVSSRSEGSSVGDADALPAYEKVVDAHDRPPVTDEKRSGGPSASAAGPAPEQGSASGSSPAGLRGQRLQAGREPLVLPICWKGGGDDEDVVDVGSALGLRFFGSRVEALGRSVLRAAIYPSFVTYCIQHSHVLKWKIGLSIAGEAVKFEGEAPVSVLGPSQSSR